MVVVVVVVVFLVTGLLGVSELLGGDVQTSDRDLSGPRLHC